MEGYLLAKNGKKVLLCDSDPQGSLTQIIGDTYHKKMKPHVSFYRGLINMNLSESIVHASRNLDIIPTNWSLSLWLAKIDTLPRNERPWILNHLLMPFKHDYDYIFIDVPPTLTQYVLNAIFASDGISIVLQTQKMSYESALLTAKEIYTLGKQYKLNFKLLGVILYLFQNAKVDRDISTKAKKAFKGAIYANAIHNKERVKGFGARGITTKDYWDKDAVKMYLIITKEMEYRVNKMIRGDTNG